MMRVSHCQCAKMANRSAAVEMKNRIQYLPRLERLTSMRKNFGKNRGAAPYRIILIFAFSTSPPFAIFADIVCYTHIIEPIANLFLMKIDFYLRFQTRFGQSLSLSGNLLSLGADEPAAALPMRFMNGDFWHASIEVDADDTDTLRYHYRFTNEHGETMEDAEQHRSIALSKKATNHLVLIDTWNYAGEYENAFYTAPFSDVFFNHSSSPRIKKAKTYTHQFRVKAPLLQPNECVCLIGDSAALGAWDADKPVLLERSGEWWTAKVDLSETHFPITYKYGVYNFKKGHFTFY
ncbi:MAG: hypothetical protein EOP50_17140, partial [Sphingobacteriales bacterium]